MTPALQHERDEDLAKHNQIAAANVAEDIHVKYPLDEILQQRTEYT